tara:strand:+ start:67 stop:405 length:339 start_codon:yes stop_codon:yes gene_type:complete
MHGTDYGEMKMKKDRRKFTPEFKVECAQLVLDQGYTVEDASRAMKVGMSTLGKWVRKLRLEREGLVTSGHPITQEQREISELKKRITRLELEKEILKKASALLMSDEMNGLR